MDQINAAFRDRGDRSRGGDSRGRGSDGWDPNDFAAGAARLLTGVAGVAGVAGIPVDAGGLKN